MARFDEQGRQLPDPRPVEWPTELKRPRSLQEEIQRFVRQELSRAADEAGLETFEEADDFDVAEDPDLLGVTPYELSEEQVFKDPSDLSTKEPLPAKPAGDPAAAGEKPQGASAPAEPQSGGAVPPPVPAPRSAT